MVQSNCMRNLSGCGLATVHRHRGGFLRLEARPCPPDPPAPTGTAAWPSGLAGALHTSWAWSLMGSAPEGLRLHARKSSPCVAVRSSKREKVHPARSNWPKFGVFMRAGRTFSRKSRRRGRAGRTFSRQPVLRPGLVGDAAHYWRTSGWLRWGFCTTRSLLAACRRRVGPPCSAIPPPIGGGAAAVRGGAVAKVQTHWVKTVKLRRLWLNGSAFWAQRCLAWCVGRT